MTQKYDVPTSYAARKASPVDIDREFKLLMTVIHREIKKLMDISHQDAPLTVKEHEAVVAYTKLLGGLKKQINEELKEMDPAEVKRLANETNK